MSNTLAKILGQGGGGLDVWASGKTVVQFDYVISPTDSEIYQRKTATGSSATDPYNDATNYRPVSVERLSSISNAWSGGAWTNNGTSFSFAGAVASAPNLPAGARTSVLSASGKGSLDFAALSKPGTATISGTIRAEIIVDGRTILDTTFATPGNYNFAVLHGWAGPVGPSVLNTNAMACPFSSSLQVFLTASAGTSVLQFAYALRGIQS